MNHKIPNILVVDDVSVNRKLAGGILAGEFLVDTVKSGREALDFFTKKLPDLVLLDIYMEGMDGFEVFAKMQKTSETAKIPVIFLTADSNSSIEIRGFKAGAVDFITKPFVPDIMRERVRRVIELSRLRNHLQEEVERGLQKIEHLSLQTIRIIVSMLEMRCQFNHHSPQVADYAWKIANHLGKSPEKKAEIYYMGLLHNIGMLGIPDEILQKSSENCTEAEQEIISQGIITGANLLKEVTELPELWMGVKYHRENYDGSGYPEGLCGKAIPEEARIIAVACQCDWLERQGRMSQEEIFAQLISEKGRRFDPVIVDAMIRVVTTDKGSTAVY